MIRISGKKLLIVLLIISSFVPNFGVSFSVFGFHWTLYRGAMFLGTLLYLCFPYRKIIKNALCRRWLLLMGIWPIYGLILMLISPYVSFRAGLLEIISVSSGAVCMYILFSIVRECHDVDLVARIMFYVFLALVLLGIHEIMTGYHLPTSHFSQAVSSQLDRKVATGIFWGENDFSSFLTCISPIGLYNKRRFWLGMAAIAGTVYINSVNDANICHIAMIIGAISYIVFIRKYGNSNQKLIRFAMAIFILLVATWGWGNIHELSKSSKLLHVITTQRSMMAGSRGSLYARTQIYIDSMKASADTSCFGIGPAAFSSYFYSHPSASGLVNPHNLYLEIMVEYGVAIICVFVFFLFKTVYTLRKKLLSCSSNDIRRKLIVGFEMLFLYSMVCIAPSSFLGYSWQWPVIAFAAILASIPTNRLQRNP